MTTPAWIAAFTAAFMPSHRHESLFSLSDRELQRLGYDRAGLQRAHVLGLGGH